MVGFKHNTNTWMKAVMAHVYYTETIILYMYLPLMTFISLANQMCYHEKPPHLQDPRSRTKNNSICAETNLYRKEH